MQFFNYTLQHNNLDRFDAFNNERPEDKIGVSVTY